MKYTKNIYSVVVLATGLVNVSAVPPQFLGTNEAFLGEIDFGRPSLHESYAAHGEMHGGQIAAVIRDRMTGYPRWMAEELAYHVLALCREHSLKPSFVLAVIHAESSFRAKVVSPAGAVGLMQVMPDTAKYLSRRFGISYNGKKDLMNPFVNITLGTAYLRMLRDKYDGNWERVLAAYNAGPGRVDRLLARRRFHIRATKPYIENVFYNIMIMKNYGRTVRTWVPEETAENS